MTAFNAAKWLVCPAEYFKKKAWLQVLKNPEEFLFLFVRHLFLVNRL